MEINYKGFKENLTDEQVLKLFSEVQEKYKKQYKSEKEETKEQTELVDESKIDEIVPVESRQQNELLKIILELSPLGFEKLCKRLLIEEGFQNVEVTKQTRDGGIDGVAKLILNKFVSFKVYFQCKKYKGSVGSETIQKFIGALDGKFITGDKGVIITTGYFTDSAIKEAYKKGGFPIELIDGEKLIEMFKNLQLGIKPKTIYEIDYDFFEDFK